MTINTGNPNNEFRVMTTGGFTAAYKLLIPELERLTGLKVITVTTSIGTGDISIPNRLKRGEIADLVICSDNIFQQFIGDGFVLAEGHAKLARSIVGFAVRAGAPKPDIATPEALRETLLRAASIGYSASVSGKHVTTQLYQRLGIAVQVMPKSRFVGGGERVGAWIARGDVEVGFQQISELLPVQGIAHITPIPEELQLVSTYTVGVGANASHPDAGRAVIEFLQSRAAAAVIMETGLEPIAH